MPDYSSRTPWSSQRETIKKIIIENGVTNICRFAFSGCTSLTSITIPNSVTSIGESAFSTCSALTSVIIPNSVKTIGSSAFSGCSSLASITISNSVTRIGMSAFKGCKELSTRDVPNASNCDFDWETLFSGTKWYSDAGDYVYLGDCLCRYRGKETNITIKNGERKIWGGAFANSGITSITIPDGVTTIGPQSFYLCYGLTSVTIPQSVTTIGSQAFYQCISLSYIEFPNPSSCDFDVSMFYGTKWFTDANAASDYVYLGDCILKYNGKDKTAKIKNGTKKILEDAFKECSALTSIEIPNSVTNIGSGAFSGCSGLTSIIIPESVIDIGDKAFWGCSKPTSITIPKSVTSIGSYAFSSAKFRNIVIKAKTPPSGEYNAFSNQSYNHTTLMIPEGCWDAYAYSDGHWCNFINIREMAYNEANLTNSKAYMMKSATEGSYLFYDSVNDCVGNLNETALDDTEENNTWMTVEIEGKHYVYNLGAKKFLVSGKGKNGYSLSDTPVSIDIEDGKDAIVIGKGKEFYMVINDKLNVDEGLESQIIATTGIKGISVDANQPTVTYNVNGQLVPNNTKGLHIRNGKKVVVK